jgi:hypothetical protein
MCVFLSASADNLVEGDENFSLILNLMTSGTSLSLGNNVTVIAVTDTDGMLLWFSVYIMSVYLHTMHVPG